MAGENGIKAISSSKLKFKLKMSLEILSLTRKNSFKVPFKCKKWKMTINFKKFSILRSLQKPRVCYADCSGTFVLKDTRKSLNAEMKLAGI